MTIIKDDISRRYLMIKRCLDWILALLVTVLLLSWLLPLLAILIKLDSTGPVFFTQRRTGRGGRSFTCYKLRTMVVNGYADDRPALADDDRITRIGRILRISHLDELPQLLNVLTGSMSLVGPRPYMLSDNDRFAAFVHNPGFRYHVKPGITGLAQIKGLHGPIDEPQTIFYRYQWDAFYVRNASLSMDLRILHMTILIFLTQKMPLCR